MTVLPLIMCATLGGMFESLTAWKHNDFVAGLVLAIFLVTLGVGLACLCLVIHFLRTNRCQQHVFPPAGPASRVRRPVLGLPSRWVAIKSLPPLKVQQVLRLNQPKPCSWAEALATDQETKLFISPPLGGWILVLGSALPDPAEDIDECYFFIKELSQKLGQVQFFSVHRGLCHHAWVQASQGEILRAYAWAGQTLWNEGRMTRAELELHLKCYGYAEPAPARRLSRSNPLFLNTHRVRQLAARWSIDPAAINPRTLRQSQGIAGQLDWRKSG